MVWQRVLPCSGCGSSCSVLTAASGNLSDGSGPSKYANRAVCQWMIAPVGAAQIAITFTYISTESCCDFIRVFKCSRIECTDLQQIAELSGRLTSGRFIIWTTGLFLIQFSSDGVVNDDGFSATWSSTPMLASSLQNVRPFYTNCTTLQALNLFHSQVK
jgi:hypothetical protein